MLKQLPEVDSYRKGVAMMNDFSLLKVFMGQTSTVTVMVTVCLVNDRDTDSKFSNTTEEFGQTQAYYIHLWSIRHLQST